MRIEEKVLITDLLKPPIHILTQERSASAKGGEEKARCRMQAGMYQIQQGLQQQLEQALLGLATLQQQQFEKDANIQERLGIVSRG